MADPIVKPDPEARPASLSSIEPASFADDDIFEDAGDLEFSTDPAFQKMYLVRMPKYVWEQWSQLQEDGEVHLGTIRQVMQSQPNGDKKETLHMLLSDLHRHQQLPKEYQLDVVSEVVRNTFVFTEQDLPGYKTRPKIKPDPLSANMPPRLNQSRVDKPGERQAWDKNKRSQPYYRRTVVPKKTRLVGKVAHEINCVPVETQETLSLLAQRQLEADKVKAGTKFIKGDGRLMNGFIQPGTVKAEGSFRDFIKDTGASRAKATAQDTKTARMPQNELLDAIFRCFEEYNYWPMKALRARLKQPEAYIRETLDICAEMAKSGRFAMLWTLKPSYKAAIHEKANEGAAPDVLAGPGGLEDSDMGENDGEDDDDDIKMEDVLPE